MKPLVVMLLIAISVQAQSLADAARKERDRQSKLKPTAVFTSVNPAPAAPETKEGSKEAPKAPAPGPVDPLKVWNDQIDQLRKKIQDLQDQETALQLQQTQLANQVYATVVDPAAKDQAQAQLAQTQKQLADVRTELDNTKKELDALQLQGPPKK